jgi:uncharacterized protein YoxC
LTVPDIHALAPHAAHALEMLLQQPGARADTVVTVMAPSHGFARAVEIMQSIASAIIALALIAIAIPLIPAAWNSRKMYARINDVVDRFRNDLNPIVKHALAVSDNLDYISTSIRVDVQTLNQTIAAANQRLNHAAALAEQRVNEFNGLLQVVQEEAESIFIDTAATIRGVTAGADTFRRFQQDAFDADGDLDEIDEYLDDDEADDDELEIGVVRKDDAPRAPRR